jgi:hypothetical protein
MLSLALQQQSPSRAAFRGSLLNFSMGLERGDQMDDSALIRIQADTLFTYDARGRTVRDNYPDGGPAPRLFVGRSLSGDLAQFRRRCPIRSSLAWPLCSNANRRHEIFRRLPRWTRCSVRCWRITRR